MRGASVWRGSANRQPIIVFFLYVPWSWCNSVSSRPTGVSHVDEGWLGCATGVRWHEFLLIKQLNMPFIPYISWNLLGFTIMRTGRPALSTSAEAGKHSESGRHGFMPIICLIMQFFLYIFWNLQRSEVDGASGTTQTASCSKATLLAFGKDASKGASGFAFRKV